MHLISRRENEGVIIGDHIFVTVLEIREDHVRMSISSPDTHPSYREETLYLDRAENLCELQLQ
jgi:carbon storage regulator CsrA